MTVIERPSPSEIRRARTDNPKTRERDLAMELGVSEAELVAAHCGVSVRRIEPRVGDLLRNMESVGEVMALTRNDSAVHEKIGIYENVHVGPRSAMTLGTNVDLRIFPDNWAHGFAVEKQDGDQTRRSLQFFDAAGEAVHKIHLRPGSDLEAYAKLIDLLACDDQSQHLDIQPRQVVAREPSNASAQDLRERWGAMTDVHQFVGMLRKLNLSRHDAVSLVGQEFAQQLDLSSLSAMFAHVVEQEVPIMCFVGNHGCIQIHSGPVRNIKPMGPWINIMDETFHLHLRQDHISELWAVRKPNKDGHVTSIEAYDSEERMIIQYFGKRKEGEGERDDWRLIADNLPVLPRSSVA